MEKVHNLLENYQVQETEINTLSNQIAEVTKRISLKTIHLNVIKVEEEELKNTVQEKLKVGFKNSKAN